MANSGTVGPQDLVLYTQYNNLRTDILDSSTGHTHTGLTDGGAKISPASFTNRTKSIFLPMGTVNSAIYSYGKTLADGAVSSADTVWCVRPYDFGTPATLNAWIQALAGTAAVVIDIEYAYASGTETAPGVSGVTYRGTYTIGEAPFRCSGTPSMSALLSGTGYAFYCTVERIGTATADTLGTPICAYGVELVYTAT